MGRMWLAIAVTVLIAASVVVGWAAKLTVNGGTLQVFTFAVDLGPVQATIDIDPDTLNPESQGKFVMAYIELPEGWDVADIDVSTVTLEVEGAYGSVAAAPSPTAVGDEDGDGIPDRMVKFSREAVVALLDGRTGDITFRVKGEVSGSPFEGTDTRRVLDSEGGAEDAQPAAPQEPPPPPPAPPVEYEVQPGDTLVDIAARFGTTVEALIRFNGLQDANLILYGSTLNVPYVGEEPADAMLGSVLGEDEEEPEEAASHDWPDSGAEEAESAEAQEAPPPPPMRTIEYEVRPGDSLIDIAARFGTTVEALTQLNGLEDPGVILYGSTLNVPYVGDEPGDVTAGVSP